MTKEDLMIHEMEIADFEGGGSYYAVCEGTDTSPSGVVASFDTEAEAVAFIDNYEEEA